MEKSVTTGAAPEIIVTSGIADLAQKAASLFVRTASDSISKKGLFTAALSGGRTPISVYSLLSAGRFSTAVDWGRAHLFWGDERCVPPLEAASNYCSALSSFIRPLHIPLDNVHRIKGEKMEAGAAEYELEIKRFFRLGLGEFPRFDLTLLGIGADGHTASIFPGTTAVREDRRMVTAVHVERLKATRITLTMPVINNSSKIMVLASGKDKARAVRDALEGDYSPEAAPAQMLRNARGRVTWIVDKDAAGSRAVFRRG